jgi:hypothetical protein
MRRESIGCSELLKHSPNRRFQRPIMISNRVKKALAAPIVGIPTYRPCRLRWLQVAG